MHRGVFSWLHLAVGRHHRRKTFRCPHGLQLSRSKVSLADHMHSRSGIHYKLCFLRLFCWRSREYPFFHGRVECSFVFLFELVYVLGKFPRISAGTSLLAFSLFTGPVLKFHSVGTSLMRIFDLYFSKRWSRILVWRCVDWVNRVLRIGPKTFCIGFPRSCFPLWNQCFRVLRDATQLWYNFHNSHSILVVAFSSFAVIVAFLRLLVWLFINLMMREHTLISGFAARFCFSEMTLGRMPIFTRRSRASKFQIISARLSKNGTMVCFALDTFFLRHTSSSWHRGLGRCGGFEFWFMCTIVALMPETATVSFRTLGFFSFHC